MGTHALGTSTFKALSRFTLIGLGIVVSLLCFVDAAKAQGSVSVDNVVSNVQSTGVNQFAWNHTIDPLNQGSLRAIAVCLAIKSTGNVVVLDVTYDGVSMTQATVLNSNVQNTRSEIYILTGPPQGTHEVRVFLLTARDVVATSVSMFGVDQVVPLRSQTSANNIGSPQATAQITSRTGDLGIDCVAVANTISGTFDPMDIPPSGVDQTSRTNSVSNLVRGLVSTEPGITNGDGTDGVVVMNWTLSASTNWVTALIMVKPAVRLGATLTSFSAEGFQATASRPGGAQLHWESGYEADNLGYYVYRETASGGRERVTPGIVAGSALFAANSILTAGNRYSWFDPNGSADSRYWLEDIDTNGRRSLHGPITATLRDGSPTAGKNAPLLSQLAVSSSSRLLSFDEIASAKGGTAPGAPPPKGSASQIATQQALASRPAVKLGVRQTGWYRLTYADLVAAGLDPLKINPTTIQLYVEGLEQAIVVTGSADNRFDPQDTIEFYGTGLDLQSTNSRTYWLTSGLQSGIRAKVSSSTATQGESRSFLATAELSEKIIYFPLLANGGAENFFGQVVHTDAVEQNVTVLNVDRTAPAARVEVALQGVTDEAHSVIVHLNGQSIGTVSFDGRTRGVAAFDVPSSLIADGSNVVTLAGTAGATDASLVEHVRITYTHTAIAENDALSLTSTGRLPLTIGGFASNGIRVVDVSTPSAVRLLTGPVGGTAGNYNVTVNPGSVANRQLLAFTDVAVKRPDSISLNIPSSWHVSRSADVAIITHRELLGAANELKQLRQSAGYRVEVIDVEDLYDEFSFGHESPYAIKAFLSSTKTKWATAPRFVVLMGDGSFDPKEYLGAGGRSLVPVKLVDTEMLETASDDWFVDFTDRDVPEMAIGRIPVRSIADASSVVAKLASYEASGNGNRSALLVADIPDASSFETASASIQAILPADYSVQTVYRRLTGDAVGRQQVLEGINAGPGIVNFVGHGSVAFWRGGLLTSSDAPMLANGQRLSFFVMSNCLNGYFHDPALSSLGEALLRSESGGAVGVWATSGMTDPELQRLLTEEFYRQLFADPSVTVGEAAMRAKQAAPPELRRSWVLLGDPLTRVR